MQTISDFKTCRGKTVQGLRILTHNLQEHKVKKREHIVSMMPANEEAFNLQRDDVKEITTRNEALTKEKSF